MFAMFSVFRIFSSVSSFVYLIIEGRGSFRVLSICLTLSFVVGFFRKCSLIFCLIFFVFI